MHCTFLDPLFEATNVVVCGDLLLYKLPKRRHIRADMDSGSGSLLGSAGHSYAPSFVAYTLVCRMLRRHIDWFLAGKTRFVEEVGCHTRDIDDGP